MAERKISKCNRGCGADIYFDGNNPEGKTPSGGWVPIDVKTNRKHNCPNYNAGGEVPTPKPQMTKPQMLACLPYLENTRAMLTETLTCLNTDIAEIKRKLSSDSFKQASTMLDDDNGEVNLP